MTDSVAFCCGLALNPDRVASEHNRLDVEYTRDEVIVEGLRELTEMNADHAALAG